MAPHRKNKSNRRLTISMIVGTFMGYLALALAIIANIIPIIGAYYGDLRSLIGALVMCFACWLASVLVTLAYRNWILAGMKSARVGDLVKVLSILLPAVWTLCLLALIAVAQSG